MCGVGAIIDLRNCDVSLRVKRAAESLLHRGHQGVGVVYLNSNNEFEKYTEFSPVSTAIKDIPSGFSKAIFAIRYGTTGGNNEANVQPFKIEISPEHESLEGALSSTFGFCLNGNYYTALRERKELEKIGYNFSSTTDTEVIACSIHNNIVKENGNRLEGIIETMKEYEGAMFGILFFEDELYILSDRFGLRPGGAYFLKDKGLFISSSETCTLSQVGFQEVPSNWCFPNGSIGVLNFDKKEFKIIRYADSNFVPCGFETIYNMAPQSMALQSFNLKRNIENAVVRALIGSFMFKESPPENGIDCVIPVPDSGNYLGVGYALGAAFGGNISRIPLFFPSIVRRRSNVVREYLLPPSKGSNSEKNRVKAINAKLSPISIASVKTLVDFISEKNLFNDAFSVSNPAVKILSEDHLYNSSNKLRAILVEDSIIRGNNLKMVDSILREYYGYDEIYVKVGWDIVYDECPLGNNHGPNLLAKNITKAFQHFETDGVNIPKSLKEEIVDLLNEEHKIKNDEKLLKKYKCFSKELITSAVRDNIIDIMRMYIGADGLYFFPSEKLKKVIGHNCDGCTINGRFPQGNDPELKKWTPDAIDKHVENKFKKKRLNHLI